MSLDNARRDWLEFSQGGFAVDLTLTNPTNLTVQIKGFATTHHLGIDPENGQPVNTKNAHVSFAESLLVDLAYPVRDASGDVSMVGHKVSYKDSTDTIQDYRIDDAMPDETIGMIVCTLGDQV